MNDMDVIKAIEQESVTVELAIGRFTVKPLTVRRLARLVGLLKEVQGDPARFRNPDSPDFYHAVADMLIAAGDSMPKALGFLAGDDTLAGKEDISLLDLTALVQAAAKVNKPSDLLAGFRGAMGTMKPEQK